MFYLLPESVLNFQSFHHPKLTYFATPIKKMEKEILKGLSKRSCRYWPFALPITEKFLRNLSQSYLIPTILPLHKAKKRVAFQFFLWKPKIMAQIYFPNHCYCLLLTITQCSYVLYSLCSFETIVIPFNFHPTIFSAKMQYNQPCKCSRSCCQIGRWY